jgi:tRNA uridine 5-carboxymethylaminomethyl modification enzyme
MLTARAEYRLRLRANNASARLTPLAVAAGCVGSRRKKWFAQREIERRAWTRGLAREVSAAALADGGLEVRRDAGRKTLAEWLRFGLSLPDVAAWLEEDLDVTSDLAAELAEDAAYAPYLERQEAELKDMRSSAGVLLEGMAYRAIPGLSREMIERLEAARPSTLADAARVRGITPAALAAILLNARRSADPA